MTLHVIRAVGREVGYPVKPVPFNCVRMTDGFWFDRMETNRTVTIPYAFRKCEETGRIRNFAKAAGLMEGEFEGAFFNDSDVYKVIEGAAYSLAFHPDADLERYVDDVIEKIAAAQWEDGYLYTYYSVPKRQPEKCWTNEGHMHELYCAGHLYEAAVAYYQATGKRKLLDIALRNADLVCSIFNPEGRREGPGHQGVEIALVRLYLVTGDVKYLNQAKFFLDVRGRDHGPQHAQRHQPVTEQEEAVGHAVRAAYMYAGMTDVAAFCEAEEYGRAAGRLWKNVVSKKMHVTGGIGSRGDLGEALGRDYELPNMRTYDETCAAVGNALFNQRMFLLHGDGKYIDVLERAVYNGFLSGVSMKGNEFFYTNPLESGGQHERRAWFDCACCPSNVARFVASIPGYVYAQKKNDLYINLFFTGTATLAMEKRTVGIAQETNYPWDGGIRITLDPENAATFSVHVRIPGWACNKPVPGNLYRYEEESPLEVSVRVNGREQEFSVRKGFAKIHRTWRKGDVIAVRLPMAVRRVFAHPKVEADVDRVAFERGPIVYCIEWPDVADGKVLSLVLANEGDLKYAYRADLLNGVGTIVGTARIAKRNEVGEAVLGEEKRFLAIPYYAWAHRGRGEMTVWPATHLAAARPRPLPSIAATSKVTVSSGHGTDALNDQMAQKNSSDDTYIPFHWGRREGRWQWVQYDFERPVTVSSVKVYWYDDGPDGHCHVPESWRILYRNGDQWDPVANREPYGVGKDAYNKVTFDPVCTDAMRLEAQLPEGYSSGIHEWIVE